MVTQIHPFHYRLLYCLICQKLKGDYRQPLTHQDLRTLICDHKVRVSESYIRKTLLPQMKAPANLGQYTLDQYARYVGYNDWNDFMRQNPVPEIYYYKLLKPKEGKLLEKLVYQRIQELLNRQLKIEFPG